MTIGYYKRMCGTIGSTINQHRTFDFCFLPSLRFCIRIQWSISTLEMKVRSKKLIFWNLKQRSDVRPPHVKKLKGKRKLQVLKTNDASLKSTKQIWRVTDDCNIKRGLVMYKATNKGVKLTIPCLSPKQHTGRCVGQKRGSMHQLFFLLVSPYYLKTVS